MIETQSPIRFLDNLSWSSVQYESMVAAPLNKTFNFLNIGSIPIRYIRNIEKNLPILTDFSQEGIKLLNEQIFQQHSALFQRCFLDESRYGRRVSFKGANKLAGIFYGTDCSRSSKVWLNLASLGPLSLATSLGYIEDLEEELPLISIHIKKEEFFNYDRSERGDNAWIPKICVIPALVTFIHPRVFTDSKYRSLCKLINEIIIPGLGNTLVVIDKYTMENLWTTHAMEELVINKATEVDQIVTRVVSSAPVNIPDIYRYGVM